nr:hypothetical protein [uncultured Bacteroides sp.]
MTYRTDNNDLSERPPICISNHTIIPQMISQIEVINTSFYISTINQDPLEGCCSSVYTFIDHIANVILLLAVRAALLLYRPQLTTVGGIHVRIRCLSQHVTNRNTLRQI